VRKRKSQERAQKSKPMDHTKRKLPSTDFKIAVKLLLVANLILRI